jgi:hypothetical protein
LDSSWLSSPLPGLNVVKIFRLVNRCLELTSTVEVKILPLLAHREGE